MMLVITAKVRSRKLDRLSAKVLQLGKHAAILQTISKSKAIVATSSNESTGKVSDVGLLSNEPGTYTATEDVMSMTSMYECLGR